MTTHSRPLSSRRKATYQRSTQRAVITLEAESSRCLRATKIRANSLADTPDLTTRTPGMDARVFFCLCYPVDPCCFCVQAFHRDSPRLPPHSEQAFVVAAVLPAAARPAEDVPPGPHHRQRADGRWHREGQTEQESWDEAAQTGGKYVLFRS